MKAILLVLSLCATPLIAQFIPFGSVSNTGASPGTTIFLTSGTTWSVPADWNNSNNTIEVIGGGGCGAEGGPSTHEGSGGNGANYAIVTNLTLTPSLTVGIKVGAGCTTDGGTAGDTWLCNANSNCASLAGTAVKVGASHGNSASHNSQAPTAQSTASDVGGTKFAGGQGGGANTGAFFGDGGGGAAGPHGAGGNGANSNGFSGGGGGGGGGGSAASLHVGGNNYLGTGGGAQNANGTNGGGGGSGDSVAAGNGGAGQDWDSTHGSGGGGGGTGTTAAGNGALYGAGGGGSNGSGTTFGTGGNGIIVIIYHP